MQVGINSRFRGLLKNWVFWLFVITGIAIIIRSIPAWTNAAWGCDFGIYYGLAKSFVESGGEWYGPYYGWGSSYNYFPVLYAVTGFAHWITGIDVLIIMPKLIPIFGGLTVFIFYFVVNSLIGDKKVALLSSLFLAVLPFHVYQTSHASPLTMGHFFMMLSILFFIMYRQKSWYFFPLIISTQLLIMSHHLTTYFYLICVIFIIFIENASKTEWTPSVKKDILYIICASGLVFSYWTFIATPVFEGFMGRGISLGFISVKSTFIVVFFYLMFFSSFGLIWLKRKYNLFFKKKKPTVKSCFIEFSLTMMICFSVMIVFLFVKLPWTNFNFTPIAAVLAIPLLLVFGFGVAGLKYTYFIRNGAFIRGWILALVISFLYAIVTNNHTILPHRHFEYIMAPLAIIAVYGIRGIFLNIDYEKLSKQVRKRLHIAVSKANIAGKKRLNQKRNLLYISIIILVSANASSVYEVHRALGQSYEVITAEDISAIEWMGQYLDKNTSLIASDHRLERMVEAEGFNTTENQAICLWTEPNENMAKYVYELYGIGENYSYSRITHVLVDDIMKNKMVHVGFGIEGINMTYESYNKFLPKDEFSPKIFELVHETKSVDYDTITGEPLHWARVFKVNWSYFWDKPGLKDTI